MPIYMDSHVLGNFTKQQLQDSLDVDYDEFGVRVLQMLFNEKENILHCICEAPDSNSILKHHQTFNVPCDSIMEIDQIQSESLIDPIHLKKIERQLREENKQLEKEIHDKNSELIKNERLATIGTMSSRIAHDLKNPLTIMHTYAEMLTPQILSKLDMNDRARWIRLQNSILDMNRIIEDVLDFARSTELNKQNHSLLRILKLSLNHLKPALGIHIELPNNDFSVICDDRKMEAVFSNVVGNAISALDGNGKIKVLFSDESDNVRIDISDSGPGIPDNVAPKIFEPLFTTKKTGTGLGLVICKSIVEQHGGTISMSQKPTTFTIVIPKS